MLHPAAESAPSCYTCYKDVLTEDDMRTCLAHLHRFRQIFGRDPAAHELDESSDAFWNTLAQPLDQPITPDAPNDMRPNAQDTTQDANLQDATLQDDLVSGLDLLFGPEPMDIDDINEDPDLPPALVLDTDAESESAGVRSPVARPKRQSADVPSPVARPKRHAPPEPVDNSDTVGHQGVGWAYYDPDHPEIFVNKVLDRIIALFPVDDVKLMCKHIAAQNAEHTAQLLLNANAVHPQATASGCSGSDNMVDWLEWLGKRFCVKLISKTFAADTAPKCRAFMRRRHPDLPTIFSDVCKLGGARAVNTLSSTLAPCPIPRCEIYVFGFVCVDISSRNQKASENRSTVEKGDGQTGSTWVGNHAYVDRYQPSHGIAENVRTISAQVSSKQDLDEDKGAAEAASNLDRCQSDLSNSGFCSIAITTSPHEWFIPQVRSPHLLGAICGHPKRIVN